MARKPKKSKGGYNTLRNRLGHFIVGGVLIIVGPVLSLFAWQSVSEGRASANWPTAKGTILESKLLESQSRLGGLSFEVKVRYTFAVDGKNYTGERFKIGGKSTSNEAEAVADWKRFTEGAAAQVHYDPSDPNRSTIETGATTGNFIVAVAAGPGILILGVVLVGLGGIMTFLARKKEADAEHSEDEDEEEVERPKAKKAKRTVTDDEDEAPPKKKAKRPPADDDEDDEPPRKRKSR